MTRRFIHTGTTASEIDCNMLHKIISGRNGDRIITYVAPDGSGFESHPITNRQDFGSVHIVQYIDDDNGLVTVVFERD